LTGDWQTTTVPAGFPSAADTPPPQRLVVIYRSSVVTFYVATTGRRHVNTPTREQPRPLVCGDSIEHFSLIINPNLTLS